MADISTPIPDYHQRNFKTADPAQKWIDNGDGTYSQARTSAAVASVRASGLASSLVLKVGAGALHAFNCGATSAAGWVLVYDAAVAPADGAGKRPLWVAQLTKSYSERFDPPLAFSTGCVLVFSTTGPVEQTSSETAFLAGMVR